MFSSAPVTWHTLSPNAISLVLALLKSDAEMMGINNDQDGEYSKSRGLGNKNFGYPYWTSQKIKEWLDKFWPTRGKGRGCNIDSLNDFSDYDMALVLTQLRDTQAYKDKVYNRRTPPLGAQDLQWVQNYWDSTMLGRVGAAATSMGRVASHVGHTASSMGSAAAGMMPTWMAMKKGGGKRRTKKRKSKKRRTKKRKSKKRTYRRRR